VSKWKTAIIAGIPDSICIGSLECLGYQDGHRQLKSNLNPEHCDGASRNKFLDHSSFP
jgi:hypothetical protein